MSSPQQIAKEIISNNYTDAFKRPTLITHQGRIFQFTETHYKEISDKIIHLKVLKYLQGHPEAYTLSKPRFATDVLENMKAATLLDDNIKIGDWLNNQPLSRQIFVPTVTGLLNISKMIDKTGIEIIPPTPDYFITACLPVIFDLQAKCPIWEKFITETLPNPETRMLFQEWVGYNLIFDYRHHKLVFFTGEGANGKSVVCTVMCGLLGSDNYSTVGLDNFKEKFQLAAMDGKLANIVEELNEIDKAEEAQLKCLASGGSIMVERKYQPPFNMRATARLTFATNVLPKISDRSDGIWRRVIVIPFKNQILDESKQDKRLTDPEFWIRSGELPGILNWALTGVTRALRQNKFTESKECSEARTNYKADSNPTADFLLGHYEEGVGEPISSHTIYASYKEYLQDFGFKPLGEAQFSKEVSRCFKRAIKSNYAERHNGKRYRTWRGIKEKNTDTGGTGNSNFADFNDTRI